MKKMARKVITEGDIPAEGELRVAEGTLFTPSARDMAAARGVRIVEVPASEVPGLAPPFLSRFSTWCDPSKKKADMP